MQSLTDSLGALGDMTEQEAVALAIMLSQEEEEDKQLQLSLDYSLSEDVDHLKLDEETAQDGDDTGSVTSARMDTDSRSGSVMGEDWQPRSYASGASFTASPYRLPATSPLSVSHGSNSRLQISPRLYPQHIPTHRSPSPIPDINNISDWPLPSPGKPSPSPFVAGSPASAFSPPLTDLAASVRWSEVARKSEAIASPTPPSRSLLAAQLGHMRNLPDATITAAEEQMDEDLKYALEISRIEEESRVAIVSPTPPSRSLLAAQLGHMRNLPDATITAAEEQTDEDLQYALEISRVEEEARMAALTNSSKRKGPGPGEVP